ncbi:hypothetical protein R6Q59_005352, partial [Mikania micrantha]
KNDRLKHLLVIIGSVLISMLCFGIFIIWCHRKNNPFAYASSKNKSPKHEDTSILSCGVSIFSYEELEDATQNFDPSHELGDGGFGAVFYENCRKFSDEPENCRKLVAKFATINFWLQKSLKTLISADPHTPAGHRWPPPHQVTDPLLPVAESFGRSSSSKQPRPLPRSVISLLLVVEPLTSCFNRYYYLRLACFLRHGSPHPV